MVRLASIQKVLQQDDLAIFIYMGDAFIVSLMLQWLKNRVLNVKYFNRKTNTGYYLYVLPSSVSIFDFGVQNN